MLRQFRHEPSVGAAGRQPCLQRLIRVERHQAQQSCVPVVEAQGAPRSKGIQHRAAAERMPRRFIAQHKTVAVQERYGVFETQLRQSRAAGQCFFDPHQAREFFRRAAVKTHALMIARRPLQPERQRNRDIHDVRYPGEARIANHCPAFERIFFHAREVERAATASLGALGRLIV